MNRRQSLKILLVPDSIYWVTGTMAQEIVSKVEGIDSIVCSAQLLHQLMEECGGSFPLHLDVVHFLTPHIATSFCPSFSKTTACVTNIHHIENSLSLEPASYVDSIMAMCYEWYEFLIKEGIEENRLNIVRYGVNTDTFKPGDELEQEKLRKKYNIPKDAFVIGFSAKRSSDSCSRKGVNILEQLITQSNVKYPSVWWVIRGPGWQSLVEQQSKLGARITHLPFLLEKRDVAESYKLMDAYIVTSRIEGGPVPLFEAMSCGLSCISTKVGLAPEIIRDGENGFLVDFDDIDSFSRLICRLEKEKNIRKRIGISARKSIVENLQWEKTLENVTEFYEKAIANFQKRIDNTQPQKAINLNSKWTENYLKNWIQKREPLTLINLLNSEGEFKIARDVADLQLKSSWLDPEIWNLYFHHSSLQKPLNFPRRLISKIKIILKSTT